MTSLLSALFERRSIDASKFGIAIDNAVVNPAGVAVTQESALRLSAVWASVRLLAFDIGALPVDALRVRNGIRSAIDPKPSWIEQPNPFDPNETGVDHMSQVVLSLLLDGNAFIAVLPSVLAPTELHVLNPQLVKIEKRDRVPAYVIQDVGELSPLNVIHITYVRRPGDPRGLSPIEAMAQGIGRGMAAEEVGARFFGQGSLMGGLVEYPESADPDDNAVKEMLKALNKRHQGVGNAWALGALTAGAKFHELTMKPSDSQLIETEEWTLEQVARAYGVPPSMVGSQKPGAVAYASVTQRAVDYVGKGVIPITVRIEKAYSRLLPRGSYIHLNTNALLRGDQAARYAAYQIALQNKFMKVDEIRGLEDLDPLGGSDGGLLQTPNNNPPADAGASAGDQPAAAQE